MTTNANRQTATGKRPSILIVDDSKANLVALRKVLVDVDAEVVEATSGNAALAATLDREFALAILDVRMPGMNGYELAGLLRGDARTWRLPIIFITATRPDEECVFKGYEAGAVDYIVKPYNPAVLLAKVRIFLELHTKTAKLAEKVEELRKYREHLEELVGERTAELRESESRYRSLFESAKDGMALADAGTGVLIDCNPALCRLVERGKSELVGQHQSILHPPQELLQGVTRLFRYHQETPDSAAVEDLLLAKSGRTIPVEINTAHVHMGGQDCLIGIFHDLTQHKQAEAERERLSAAIEQAVETIVITDVKGSILYCNPAFEKTTGYTRQETLGKNPRILKSGKQDATFYKQMWDRITHGEVWVGRLVNKRKDGSLFMEEATISPVRDNSGAIVNYVAVKRDITHELEMEAQLRQVQRLESVGRLAGGVAHDFNNLLTVILGYTELANNKLSESDPIREDILEIQQAGQRAAALTRQLLAFSRKQVLEPQVLDINGVVTGLEKMLARLLGEDIDISLHLSECIGSVMADPGQVEQVIVNLCVNARDAMPKGGRLTIGTANAEFDREYAGRHVGVTPGRYVMLSITDTGCGMDADTRERIFEPFFTTKEKGKGTGLGLSTVYGIIKQSGGDIWVYSEPGLGTTFKVYLPRVDEPAVDLRPQPIAAMAVGSETVLVVEDEDMVRRLAGRILRKAGYTVLSAANGGEALLLCEKHGAVDLLLTDVVMPQMSGRELAERLVEMVPGLKVLYMSGYTDDAIVHHGVLEPGTRFIGKPFTAEELTRKAREVLDERRISGEYF